MKEQKKSGLKEQKRKRIMEVRRSAGKIRNRNQTKKRKRRVGNVREVVKLEDFEADFHVAIFNLENKKSHFKSICTLNIVH